MELTLLFLIFVFVLQYFVLQEGDRYFMWPGGDMMNLGAALIPGILLVTAKFITFYHSKRFAEEYIPVDKRFTRIRQPKPVTRTGIVDPSQAYQYEEERVTFS